MHIHAQRKWIWFWSGSYREVDLVQSLHHYLYHNFYHKFDHNCGLGVQGKLSRRTWHYQRCAGEAIAAYLALSKGGKLSHYPRVESYHKVSHLSSSSFGLLETPSQKPSILYRNRTRNEPFLANFRADPFGELDLRAGSLDLRDQRIRRPWTCGNPFMWVYFYPYRSPFGGPCPRPLFFTFRSWNLQFFTEIQRGMSLFFLTSGQTLLESCHLLENREHRQTDPQTDRPTMKVNWMNWMKWIEWIEWNEMNEWNEWNVKWKHWLKPTPPRSFNFCPLLNFLFF